MVSLLSTKPTPSRINRTRPVRVNGCVISHAAIAREVQNHAAETPAEAWLTAARALAVRELLLQEARRTGLVAAPERDAHGRRETDDDALVRMLIAREVTTPEPSEEECRRVYESRRQKLCTPNLYEVRHILVAVPPRDASARAEAEEAARAIIAELLPAQERFSALAKVHSACPSANIGGSLGQIGPGQTVPEFEAALAALPVGAVAPRPVETRYGFHVVLVEHRIAGQPLPFEIAKTTIAHWLSQRVYRTAVRQYISVLAGRAQIEGIDLAAASSPLLQ